MILLLESAIVAFIEAKLPDNIPSSGLHSTENEKEHHGAHSAVRGHMGPKWPKSIGKLCSKLWAPNTWTFLLKDRKKVA